MTIALNHTIVWCRDQRASAGFLADLFGLPAPVAWGPFLIVEMANGVSLPMVTSPVQFDGRPNSPVRAPEHGEHTESVLLELGLSWDEISALKRTKAIL